MILLGWVDLGNVISNDFIFSSINNLMFFEPDFNFYLF